MVQRIAAIIGMFRLPNLLIVALSQAIPYWCVLRPAILKAGGIPALSTTAFGYLCMATVLTTLAGYVINDYFDRDIDRINRPHRVVVGKWISPNLILMLYWGIQAGIALIALRLHWAMPAPHSWWALWVFPAVSLLLFLYAWQLKCSPFLGNILVALLCGITPLLIMAPESRPLWLASFHAPSDIREAMSIVWVYGLFAMGTNLYREQIKDLEDFQGDSACGCHTIAVLRGVRFAKKNAGITGVAVCALLLALMQFWQDRQTQDWRMAVGVITLLFPCALSVFLVLSAKEKKHFTYASAALKITMFSGIFMLLPYWPASRAEWEAQWQQVKMNTQREGLTLTPK